MIEPLVSKQWFVVMEPMAEKGLNALERGDISIIPERFEKVSALCELFFFQNEVNILYAVPNCP